MRLIIIFATLGCLYRIIFDSLQTFDGNFLLYIKGCDSKIECKDPSILFGLLTFILYTFDLISNYLIALFFSVSPNKINKSD